MNMLTCIYCEKEYLKEDLSKSDIIPFAFLAGEKLTLNSKVCKTCNNLVNKNAEQTIIKEFESLRRRINVTQRRGQLIKNQFVIEYENDDIKLRTNPIKAIEPETILTKPMYFKDENDKGVIIGPYEKTMEIASSKGDGEKVAKLEITNNFSIYESYSVPMESFFSKEMKTMVAKICYEWLIKISPELNPFEKTYKNIRESIYKDKVDKEGIVDVITNREIAKGLFEDLSHLKDLKETEYVPKRLVVGDYYLFFEIKNGGYYCFFAFMGLVLYRVCIATEGIEEHNKNLMVSLIYKYKGRTGELEILEPNGEHWGDLSYLLSNKNNYNNMEDYSGYLRQKINELIQYKIIDTDEKKPK